MPCVDLGLCPEVCMVNILNWHPSQFLTLSPLVIVHSSTISKQWHVGQTYVHAPQPIHLFEKSSHTSCSKFSSSHGFTLSISNFFSTVATCRSGVPDGGSEKQIPALLQGFHLFQLRFRPDFHHWRFW